jgi:16S rRNA (guanine966-N2)-methyltransferase
MGVGEQRVRIVSGEFRGRRLLAPRGDATRPTADRVREGLFSSLVSLSDARLVGNALDAFAGSGALGLEALSRGIDAVTFVECDRPARAALEANISALGVQGRTVVIGGDSLTLARQGALRGGPFSLLLLDPPYRLACSEIAGFISAITARDLLEDGAFIVYEHACGDEVVWPAGVTTITRKRYGKTEVDIAGYEKEDGSS